MGILEGRRMFIASSQWSVVSGQWSVVSGEAFTNRQQRIDTRGEVWHSSEIASG